MLIVNGSKNTRVIICWAKKPVSVSHFPGFAKTEAGNTKIQTKYGTTYYSDELYGPVVVTIIILLFNILRVKIGIGI